MVFIIQPAARFLTTGILIILAVSLFACVEKKMSLTEAKQVSVAMRQNSFTPPPRSIEDIVWVLNQPGTFDKNITAATLKKADALPPNTNDPKRLSSFYQDRGNAANGLGRAEQELQDKRTALVYARNAPDISPKKMSSLLRTLGLAEIKLGNFKTGQDLCREGLGLFPTPSHYYVLAATLFKMGDFDQATQMIQEGIALCNRAQKRSGNKKLKIQADKEHLNALYFSSLGQHKKAEPHWQQYHLILESVKDKRPSAYLRSFLNIGKNLKSQGRLMEAELQVRQGLRGAIAHAGKNSSITGAMAGFFGEVLLKQGRIEDAQKMILASIDAYEKAGVDDGSTSLAKVRTRLGEVIFAREDFMGAAQQFEVVKKDMASNLYIYNTRVVQNPNIILTNLLTGNIREAMDSVAFFYKNLEPYFGNKQYKSAEILAMRAMIHARQHNDKQALEDFSRAVPILFQERADEEDFLKNFRQKLIVESYMDFLFSIKKAGQEDRFHINASGMIFKLCEQLNASIVQGALGASGARSAAVDPALSDLVRKEQDASKQINAMKRSMADLAAAGEEGKQALSDLNANISSLTRARHALLEEIETRFPRYAEFINPKPKEFDQIQRILNPEESMVIMYPGSGRVYIWGIPKTGGVEFSAAQMNEKELKEKIRRLRNSLAPSPEIFDDIPEFDLVLAHGLFLSFFKPVEKAWKQSRDLLVVAPGFLGQIPFGILPTSPGEIGRDKSLLYDRYRRVDWLIRQASITRLPSVASLMTLRTLPRGNADRQAFVGFGDPVFNLAQLSLPSEKGTASAIAKRGVPLRVRGIRKVKKAKTTPNQNASVTLGDLGRLPDTAEEIMGIAQVMAVDPTTSVFLGKNASEGNAKALDLSAVKVVAFASHGLVPGDLDGLTQPAIALSAPEVTMDPGEDGLLTMGEILKFKLNADWVILSACNTGAADGAGAEAVSGLGQAFFYAGTRALLVTLWSVESTSAKQLTTGLFLYQNKNPDLSRARALQASMLDLIDIKELEYKGRVVASYAHPFFWAPFIVVGDGG